jgi:hypothetical protein
MSKGNENQCKTFGCVNQTALHLRAVNMLYDGLTENPTIVLVPSAALPSMQLDDFAAGFLHEPSLS